MFQAGKKYLAVVRLEMCAKISMTGMGRSVKLVNYTVNTNILCIFSVIGADGHFLYLKKNPRLINPYLNYVNKLVICDISETMCTKPYMQCIPVIITVRVGVGEGRGVTMCFCVVSNF